jgi:hypothetical protein
MTYETHHRLIDIYKRIESATDRQTVKDLLKEAATLQATEQHLHRQQQQHLPHPLS